ncbi:bifunctional diaminohydroxyphosphoribosylaminopyrimidine deaminase/5-amino-6-(5-phosphoribosylamino)uracil reductase RibD [Iodobacter fluviatilis]|uniref:Riboflavin biosynthesis protein RibD n=1 Tax=Iodobacter fluviatilis TaxID=537 RepID=A0A377Q9G7_9NEIS|nr:bifunctional diaminohydroxyphosphoribosylaminopyrimidine deaminase/5-amino-6-(5-phosphoribosylamino)uracil reductase RibD [Iodobacter fluviatilis]TCU88584.1 diaminohydroxyphosphoribosylaminopyrimidine deaminase/5-amino-6-(5-phosphoribosylamino)uracil reductase [Iodobacter fluviatilis]STQ91345.1 Riboflavin biosynthesis protein RibD [Iodobacter fluviatilis]
MNVIDHQYMQLALQQAALGQNSATPNPSVGCVLVKNGQVVGAGFSQPAGGGVVKGAPGAHAEVMALSMAGDLARGATAYVSLEPCSHHGRTPPCADALVKAGVVRVVAALTDPNPLVAGQGLARLAAAGIEVSSGVLHAAALEHHKGFISRMVRSRPWLTVKMGASLDGRTALANGQSQWITGPAARSDVQKLRARSCAMLTGVGTVLADDPQLTVREFAVERQPLRVVLDSQLRTPPDAKLFKQAGVLIVAAQDNKLKRHILEAAGAEVLILADAQGRVDLNALLQELAVRGCNQVTVEAGGTLVGGLFQAGWVDELLLYQAPVIIGDTAKGIATLDLTDLNHKLQAKVVERRLVGDDLRLTLRFTDAGEFYAG